MADAAAVILSGIQKLDTWLLQKDLRDDDHARLCSLRSEKKCVLVGMILSAIQKLGRWLLRKADHRNYYARLRSLRLGKKNLVVGMMDVWENDNEMLYSLLVRVADLRDVEGKVDSNKLYSFVGEVEDLWELNCRENLHTLLLEMLDLDPKIDGEKVFSLAVEMADLWKDIKGKLNKEKLYSWLAKKTELWEEDEQFSLLEGMALRNGSNKEDELFGSGEEDELFSLLEGMALRNGSNDEDELFRILDEEEDWKKPVEGVRNDLRLILNKLEDEGSSHSHLHYFMSDAVEMAHDVQLLVHLKESDPIILFLQIQVNNRDFSGSISDCFFHIKPIPEWLQETERRVRKFRADETSNVREELVGPSPTYSESDHHAVGLEEDVEWLLSVLCNDETTICIHGLPGSGKTTLAREFYNHPEIVDGYECRAWVCLSSWKLSRKELLIQLIRQLIDSSKRDDMVIEKMENKALRQMLHQHLQDKPYLIVLDDVSEETYLQYVYQTLPQDKRSRLLFTTRNHEISCKPEGDYEHKMKNLNGDKSWQFLLQTTLCSDDKFPMKLEKRGREMLMRKCGGLPLAIKEMGRHWAEKRRSGSEWKEIVVEESLMNLELSETSVALESTYLNMDPQVKQCFLRLTSQVIKKTDAAAVILSAIEKLDSWLLQKADHRNDDHARLCSLRLEKKDLLVGMAELWENDREMLYSLLVRVAGVWNVKEENNKDKLYSFLGEVEDLWELNCRENLHTLLLEMMDPDIDMEKLFSLVVEMTDLWRDSKGKLNKEKLYTWLAKETDLWEEDNLFRLLHRMTFLEGPVERMGLLTEEYRKYVEGVRNDLKWILDFLNKLEDEGSSHSHLHYFMSDVLEMAHDVQLLAHVKDSDPIILFLQIFDRNRLDCFLKFFDEIKLIHQRLQETEKRVRKLGADDETSQLNNVREELVGPCPTYSESDHHAVGLKDDVELLLRNRKTTIRIRGMAGIGKTTLAREFYNHPEIVNEFECRAWVCLSSRKLSRKELLIKLIRQFIHMSKRDDMVIEKMENKDLRQMLHQHLQDKPYVIVLDDVSEETYLQYVYRTLPQDNRSRLLFTTVSHKISCTPYGDCQHMMKSLDGDKSWQLLMQTTLRSDDKFPKQLEKKGREMLMRKCGGLPLAIKEVGRHWAEKRRSGSEWKELVVEESLMNLELIETLVALESTYFNMDPKVKPCFLRLAFFKEGTIIRKKKLIQIWTAGGLLENQSQSGFDNLSQQSIIEEVHKTKNHNFTKTIRINAVFHKLSITKAMDEIGFEIIRKDGSNRASHERRHHRVVHCSRDDKFNYNYSSTNQDKHLVSLFFHGSGGYSSICPPSYWKHFEQLKVLDMEGFGLKILSETVGDLTELRYLGLRNNYIQELPQSLRCLKMIEVLDIAQNFMVEVPDILWDMDRLRHLYMSDIICRKPLKIEALENLETLTYISVDNWTYEVSGIKMMTRLYKLGIEEVDENTNVSELFASLAKLEKLDCLILRGFHFRSMPSLDELGLLHNLHYLKLEGRLTRLPSATNFPPRLWKLVLVNSCLDEDPIPILEKLPLLHNLHLQNAYTGHEMVISNEGFHQLHYLVIRELWNLRNIVKVGEVEMWYLERSEINSCPYLETVPQEIFWRLDHLQSQSVKCATP